MTIDEVIKSEKIKAEYLKEQINSPEPYIKPNKCLEMAEEHEQIAKWLEELKHYKEIENGNGRSFLTTDQIHDLCTEALIKGRVDAIDDCKNILRSHHMFRICEDDYNAKIEVPFYKGLWKAFDQLKENKQ